ncbi:type I DNA topoisomerase [Bacteroides fluxus]|uniref:DNA topoisomerase 1 n=1 Tax=Bacteroides fluxus YIT 12057 TaxID=763034 RepID=F3PW35_9BACE|nr:type I DNA topoisomerase [Bacteroides fluxus]EGF52613.1 DNA topoisomerase I [Bacteroides fluxus YIT 12057]
MQKNLVIVESPAKAKTIEKFLGKDFKVLSSYGHIRDLKKKQFSIDIEDDFKPHYEIPVDKKKIVTQLKEEAEKAETVWLASDEDREGEAIAWHLYEVLKLKPEQTKRIVFHEITKGAILKAIENPRNIDINLVDAQQARRILDRIVGFELSPVLWKKVKPALSAGRVQSVAVRLIVEREREIHAFRTEAAYRVTAIFLVPDADGKLIEMKAELARRIKTKAEAQKFLESCKSSTFTINDINTRPLKKTPAAPFTTSTLQQEAARKLGFTVAQTMMVAQHLYESGNITYMRTDSVNLSEYAVNGSKEAITHLMGERYVFPRHFATKTKGAQEAHEAIRPTYMENAKIEGTAQERKLYDLIWKRTIASQMADAEVEKTTVSISISNAPDTFTATGEVVKFDGFLRVYRESYDDDVEMQEDEAHLLPPLAKGQELQYADITATERFTQHPPRYTEASLVRKLEELGIGRPSTYAPTISTIQQREYVVKGEKPGEERTYDVLTLKDDQITDTARTEITGAEKSKLLPTDTGMVVNDFLIEYFPNILDYNFTANVEKQFDEIAEGDKQWTDILRTFYDHFHPSVESTLAAKNAHKAGERILGTEPATGKQVSVKIGRFGPVAQIGTSEDEEKPRFAQLGKDMSLETITLEEALELFKLPRNLGEYEDKMVTIGAGRFGPYILYNRTYVSLPKTMDPMTVTLEEAVVLLQQKQEEEAKRHLKKFEEEPDLEIINGRYGPYIAYKGGNYKIPKDIVPQDLSLTACLEIVKLQSEKEANKPKRGTRAAARTTKTSKAATSKKTKASTTKTTAKK